jgi:2-keto-4-pentenoate hydratase
MNPLADPRIANGMKKQLAARRERLAAGEAPLGWKVGMSSAGAKQAVGTTAPMVAYTLRRGLLSSGATVSLKGWVQPVAEAEIAVHIGRDLGADAGDEAVRGAIAALGPAIELVDVPAPPTAKTLEDALASGMFQRHVVLGPADASRAGGNVAGLRTRVARNGADFARMDDPEVNTGKVIDVVRHVATMLAAFGERLSAGEVIIAGSITAPIFLETTDQELVHALDPIGVASVSFSR